MAASSLNRPSAHEPFELADPELDPRAPSARRRARPRSECQIEEVVPAPVPPWAANRRFATAFSDFGPYARSLPIVV